MSDDQSSDRAGRDAEADDSDSERDERRRRGPLSDLTDEIERRRKRRGDADLDDAFEDVSVGSVDADAVWEQLNREDAEPIAEASVGATDAAVGASDTQTAGGQESQDLAGRDVRVVEKRSFCQGCQYLSDPPSVACTHEGTEILELVDADHFRVVDCPMVAEAEALTDELRSDGS